MDQTLRLLMIMVGELVGDAACMFSSRSESTDCDERKIQFYMAEYSPLIAMAAMFACVAIQAGFQVIFGFLKEIEVRFALGNVFISTLFLLLRLIKHLLEAFGSLSSVLCFLGIYDAVRNTWQKYLVNKDDIGKWESKGGEQRFFEYDPVANRNVLLKKWKNVRDCLQVLICIHFFSLLIYYGGMTLSGQEISGSIFCFQWYELIPIGISKILTEKYFFLDFDQNKWFIPGILLKRLFDNREKKNRQSEEEKPWDLLLIKKSYEEERGNKNEFSLEKTAGDNLFIEGIERFLEDYRQNEDSMIRYFGNYLTRRQWQTGRRYDPGVCDMTVHLMRGEHVFCASPFYRDIDISIFFPLWFALLKGGKGLVLMEDCGNMEELADWLRQGVSEIQGLEDFWRVQLLRNSGEDTEIGILSFQELYQPEEELRIAAFLKQVRFAVVLEASYMLAGGQEAIENLGRKMGSDCVWFLCDKNAESVLDLFSHLLLKQFCYVNATPRKAKELLVGWWNTEHEDKMPLKPVKHWLGAETKAVRIAVNCNVDEITIYGEDMIPVREMHWILGQYVDMLREWTKNDSLMYQYQMDERLKMEMTGTGRIRKKQCALIVEDSDFNLIEAVRQYATCGIEQVLIHVMSPRYMLRDFMKCYYEQNLRDPKYIAQFVPEYVNTTRNVAIRIIRRMLDAFVSEWEIQQELMDCEEWSGEGSGPDWVKDLLKEVIPGEYIDEKDCIETEWRWNCGNGYAGEGGVCFYRLSGGGVRRWFSQYFQKACYVDEQKTKRYINKLILAGHLDLKYLPGQMAVFDGVYYEILKKNSEDKDHFLSVRRASDQLSCRRYYRQDREYEFSRLSPAPGHEKYYKGFRMARCTADITASTAGYYQCESWNSLKDENYVKLKDDAPRKYHAKQCLRVTMDAENCEKMIQTACMLQECLCTFYPHQYYLLSVAVDREAYKDIRELRILRGVTAGIKINDKTVSKSRLAFYVIEDSAEDMGLVRSLERNFERILELLEEYRVWNETAGDDYLNF